MVELLNLRLPEGARVYIDLVEQVYQRGLGRAGDRVHREFPSRK